MDNDPYANYVYVEDSPSVFEDDDDPFTEDDVESVVGSVSLEDSFYRQDTPRWEWDSNVHDYTRWIGPFTFDVFISLLVLYLDFSVFNILVRHN